MPNARTSIAEHLGIRRETTFESARCSCAILQTIEKLPPDAAEIARSVAGQKPSRILEAASSGLAWSDLKNTHVETFTDAAWDTPAASLSSRSRRACPSSAVSGEAYRQTSKLLATLVKVPLPKKVQARIELVDRLIAVEKAREELAGRKTPR